MTQYFNRQEQKPVRQRLRNEATKAERLLWSRLKHSQLDGLKFRRQHGVGEYVIDLYCPEAKLAIEADGESHFDLDSRAYDERRTAFLDSFGIHVLRFTNSQVYKELDWVIGEIWFTARERRAKQRAQQERPLLVPPFEGGRREAGRLSQAPILTKEGVGGGRLTKSVSHSITTPLNPPLVRGEAADPPKSPLSKGGGL